MCALRLVFIVRPFVGLKETVMPTTPSLASDTIDSVLFNCSAGRKMKDHDEKSGGTMVSLAR